MQRFVDLSHEFADGMPGLRMQLPDGSFVEGTARVRSWLTREQTAAALGGEAAFEVSEMHFPTPIGTYLDSPYNRYPEGRDIADLRIDELVLPGIAIDVRHLGARQSAGLEVLPKNADFAGKAVLFNFGWDRYWGKPAYDDYPHISPDLADHLLGAGARLLAFDTGNADAADAPAHPVHTRLLARDVFIVENLTAIDKLHGSTFRFFAVPIKGRKVASMPIRAFAELL